MGKTWSLIAMALLGAMPLLSTAPARAEDPNAAAAPPAGQPILQPVYYEQPQQPAPVPIAEEPPSRESGRGIEYGGHIIVPIFIADEHPDITLFPGIGIQGRVGWEFPGGFTTEMNLGVMVNVSDAQFVFDGRDAYDYSITNLWVGAGARYAFYNISAFVPLVGAGIALNIWNNAITYDDFDGSHTESIGDGAVSLGFNALVGLAIELSSDLAIEAGLQANYTFPPPERLIPAQPKMWITPFIGGTLYYD